MSKVVKAINERFEDEGGHEEAIEVDLSNLDLTTISKDVKKALDKAKGIEVLVISENKLTSLEGLPDWKLSSLNVSSNKYFPTHSDSLTPLSLALPNTLISRS
jgi:hypothetical protein